MVCPITQGDHKKPQGKNIMACPITQGGHKTHMTAQAYACNVDLSAEAPWTLPANCPVIAWHRVYLHISISQSIKTYLYRAVMLQAKTSVLCHWFQLLDTQWSASVVSVFDLAPLSKLHVTIYQPPPKDFATLHVYVGGSLIYYQLNTCGHFTHVTKFAVMESRHFSETETRHSRQKHETSHDIKDWIDTKLRRC